MIAKGIVILRADFSHIINHTKRMGMLRKLTISYGMQKKDENRRTARL